MGKGYKRILQEYDEKYGHLPIEHEELLSYLESELHLTEKDFEKIHEENERARSLPWEELRFVIPIIPKPTPRPRYSDKIGGFYVVGAAENQKLFKYLVEDKYHIIYTQTHFKLDAYLPTPKSALNRIEMYRAEMKEILPISNPDFDNLLKTYSDMMQHRLILNDNIISHGECDKYYSIKPRVEITVKYQLGYDSKFNQRRTESSTAYKRAVETGHITYIYTDDT